MSGWVPSLAELFPDGDYEFQLTLRRTPPRDFFAERDPGGRVLAERARWLESDPRRYLALKPEGEELVAEFARMAATWRPAGEAGAISAAAPGLAELGRSYEPDLLFLSRDGAGEFRLRGGALCFPTGWALEEKLGQTLEAIHGVVPGLNPALGRSISMFLARLKPGIAYLRHNWGIAATDELNLHPARGLQPPSAPVSLDRLWLRVEHQALVALPESGGVLFGIRIASHRLDGVAGSAAAAGLRRALETMPAELAEYKRVECIRKDVIGRL